MPVLYKVTEQQVLASAGLDAYVVSLQTCTLAMSSSEAVIVPGLF
jgi:hypothetical protein